MIVRCPSCSTRFRTAAAAAIAVTEATCSRCRAVFVPTAATRQYVVLETVGVGHHAGPAAEASFEMAPALTMAVAAHVATEVPAGHAGPTPVADAAAPVAEADPAMAWDDALSGPGTPAEPSTPAEVGRSDGGRVIERAAAPLRDLGLPPGMMAGATAEVPVAPAAPGSERGDATPARRERPEPVARPSRARDVAATPGRRSRPLLEALVALVCGGLGAAGTWYSVPTFRSLDLGNPTWNAWLRQPEPLHWGALGAALGLLVAWALVRWMARDR